MALTQEAVLSFLLERGGKVKNSELVTHFKSLINSGDPAEKQHNRELFKKLVNSVAVVRQIDGVKFVAVRKRYQDFVKEEMDQSLFGQTANSDARRSSSGSNYYSDDKSCAESLQESGPAASTADSATVKVLNISRDQPCRASKSGSMFAVIAVRSPERDSAAGAREGLRSKVHQQHGNPDKAVIRVPSLPALTSNSSSHQRELIKEPQCWKAKQTEAKQAPGSPLVRPQNKTLRQADDESVPLEPIAHEWLVKCAAGLWGQIYALLLQDTRLAQKKDFMSGFTALHWAAKDGSCEIIHKLIDVSSKRGTCVNVNSKAHGGYTPLHIAAMHGHSEVMVALVQRYGASVSERDNDGKKALHYMGKGASAEVRALLGGPQQSREKMEGEEYKEHTRGFNTISKLFHPHLGKKHKTCRFAHEW